MAAAALESVRATEGRVAMRDEASKTVALVVAQVGLLMPMMMPLTQAQRYIVAALLASATAAVAAVAVEAVEAVQTAEVQQVVWVHWTYS